jgi:hypothetical protein
VAHGPLIAGAQPLDCRVAFSWLHSNRCVFGYVAAFRMQPAVSLHSAYFRGIRSTGLEPRPRPGHGFRATSRPRARKNRAPEPGPNPRELRGHLSSFPVCSGLTTHRSCRHGSLRYEIILPCLFSCFLRRRQLINSHQTGTRVSILLSRDL